MIDFISRSKQMVTAFRKLGVGWGLRWQETEKLVVASISREIDYVTYRPVSKSF
jgi:hypothetical protein